jgi:hypothetical protein
VSGDNYGIQHSGKGDIVNSGVQMFGGKTESSTEETVRNQLAELRKLLAAHQNELSLGDRADAAAQLAIVDTHVQAPAEQRDKKQVMESVGRLVKAVGSVTSLVSSAGTLGQVIEQLFR